MKVHGDHLVVLRRGRLFTVEHQGQRARAGLDGRRVRRRHRPARRLVRRDADPRRHHRRDRLQLRSAAAPRSASSTSIAPGGSRYRATYHLRSNDYYSSRNYASRLIGDKLDLLHAALPQPCTATRSPRSRRCATGTRAPRRPSSSASRRPRASIAPTTSSSRYGLALHTVTVCDLAKRDMDCESHRRARPARDACSTFRRARCSSGPRMTATLEAPALRGVPHPARRLGAHAR